MGLFWRRKSKDEFVTLGLNEPAAPQVQKPEPEIINAEPAPATVTADSPVQTEVVPAATGSGPTPTPVEIKRAPETRAPPFPASSTIPEKPVKSRTPFATSVLGLNLSMEELQAQEAALEQEFSARFKRAVAATR